MYATAGVGLLQIARVLSIVKYPFTCEEAANSERAQQKTTDGRYIMMVSIERTELRL